MYFRRTGVFSFARYDENFYSFKESTSVTRPGIIRFRSCMVTAHEIGHMFGLKHCIAYSCIMNGSNHLEESIRRPMDVCPVCLSKLQYNIKFDVVERYKALEAFCKEQGEEFLKKGEFISKILKDLETKGE